MSRCLVTGGTGFIGSHVVRALLERGEEVRCLVRPGRDHSNLDGLPVERVRGDLRDLHSIRRAVEGVSVVYHCAADYRLWAPDPAEIYRTNVGGTENVLEAAARAGTKRVVYTSSVGALGLESRGRPADERTPVREADMIGHYKRSKYQAERLAEAFAVRGLPVVVVNPSTPIGPMDRRPTPTGEIILDFLHGRAPAYVDSGLNLVDVRDVATGHILAATRGRIGDKYILGGTNLTLKELYDRLAEMTGRRSPRVRLPHCIPLALAALEAPVARLRRRPPRIPLEAVRMSKNRMFFSSDKAICDLGYAPRAIEPALEAAVTWFMQQGYVDGPMRQTVNVSA